MPKSIYIFKNLDDAISILGNYGQSYNFPESNFDKIEIVNRSVTSNIFRAFKVSNHKPSQIYRKWAMHEFDNIIRDFNKINDLNAFDKFIIKYGDSLIDYWANNVKNTANNLIFGPAYKMVNLLIKTIQHSQEYKRDVIFNFQHIPFDLYSLKPLTNIINDLTNKSNRIAIPSNVSMKFVNCSEIYWLFTNSIRVLSNKAKILPIVYDYWSWNEKHIE